MPHANRPRCLAVAALALAAVGCGGGADIWLEGRVVVASAEGLADDASPATPVARFGGEDGADYWARDSLTTAYTDPPLPGRLAGGVTAEPVDTAMGSPAQAVARSVSRVTLPMEVRRGGRVELEVLLELFDIELSGAGVCRAQVAGAVAGEDGGAVPGGDLGTLLLEVQPDGTVILDDGADEPGQLEPPGRFARSLRGPVGGVELAPGRYRVTLELALEATAPARAGPNQLARIGQGWATLRVP